MNIALILAGGSGNRMEAEVPKQFILIYGANFKMLSEAYGYT